MRKVIINHLFFAGLFYIISNANIIGPDLNWNMFLALVAYDLAVLTFYLPNRWLAILSTLVWLAFFPNTFYMLTDIFHMGFVEGGYRDNDVVVRFMIYISSILFGVLCGMESWNLIVQRFKLSWLQVYIAVPILSGLSALAISIGRFERFNSWDLAQDPMEVVRAIIDTFSWQRLPLVLGFTFFQILCLLFIENASKK